LTYTHYFSKNRDINISTLSVVSFGKFIIYRTHLFLKISLHVILIFTCLITLGLLVLRGVLIKLVNSESVSHSVAKSSTNHLLGQRCGHRVPKDDVSGDLQIQTCAVLTTVQN